MYHLGMNKLLNMVWELSAYSTHFRLNTYHFYSWTAVVAQFFVQNCVFVWPVAVCYTVTCIADVICYIPILVKMCTWY